MDYYLYPILFVFGLAVGSFLNVVALRYNPQSSILNSHFLGGRSKCPVCHKTLAWYELIPIFSFLIQKKKCRHCGHLISLQYPLVEILTGIIFVAVPWYVFNNFQFSIFNLQSIAQPPITDYHALITAIWILIFLFFLLLSIIDFRRYIIPDLINLSLAVLGVILIIANFQFPTANPSFLGHYASLFDFWPLSAVGSQWSMAINHLFAALLAMIFFGAIILLTKGRAMGWGDFKLVGALGLIFGWPDILIVLFLAFVVGAVFSVVLLMAGKKKIKDAVPFGPFLIVGASATFFFGYQIIDGYFKLFGL